MNVRTATVKDIPSLIALERASDGVAHWSKEHYEALFATSPTPRLALVTENADGIQGFLIAKRIAQEWEIENLVVAPAIRRQGYASRLMGTLMNNVRAEAAKSIFLEVRESNIAARSLYGKMGFRLVGLRSRYYHHPDEDGLNLRLDL